MPKIFGTRYLGWIVKRLSKSSKMKKSDEALALELQDEEFAHELQFHEFNREVLESKFVREFDESLMFQASSSASSSSNSKTSYPGSMACTEPEVEFLRSAFGINLALHIPEKECGICFDTLPQSCVVSTPGSMACTEPEEEFLRSAFGINLAQHIPEKECGICFDTLPRSSFVSTPGCVHEYCSGCCQNHAEAKIMSGSSQIKCPEGTCVLHYSMEQCRYLLSDSSFDALNTRLTEAAIPAALQVFCPFVDCSAFMEKSATTDFAVEPFAECYACHRGFCVECIVPWHAGQTCGERRANEMNNKLSGDAKLLNLAKKKKWQQCPDCNRVIDLLRGCNHMTCLCGLEFCYVCGAKWKNKVATCKCDL